MGKFGYKRGDKVECESWERGGKCSKRVELK